MTIQYNKPPHSAQREKILTAVARSQPAQKLRLARDFQARNPNDAFANLLLAKVLSETGDGLSAIPFAQQATKISQFAPEATSLLARLYFDFGLLENLGPLLAEGLKRHPAAASLASDQGDYLNAINRPVEAIDAWKRALTLTQSGAFAVAVKKALVDGLRTANRNDEAQALLEDLKSIPEARPFAIARLAAFAGREEAPDFEKDIAELLAQPHLATSDRVLLHLALGNLFDRCGFHERAFESWHSAKRLSPPEYNAAKVEALVDRTIRFFDADLLAGLAAFGSTGDSAVFVVGMPRSGTTLVEQILSAHSQVAGVGELGRMGRRLWPFLDVYDRPGGVEDLRKNAMRGELITRAKEHQRLAFLMAGREYPRMVDKMPTQFLAAGYIHLCMPRARFIHIRRHPADTFISSYQNNFNADYAFTFNQEAFAHFHVQRERLMAHWRSIFPNQILDLNYEDLANRPEPEIRRILAFLGLEWEEACLQFHEKTQSVRTFSRDQVRQSINTRSIGRWRNYEAHLGPLFSALQSGGSPEYALKT